MDNTYSPEVEYTNDYYHFMSPAMIDCIALNSGFSLPRRDGGFSYCELGCGFGLTTSYLAATHPEGRFFGIDLNAMQIGVAQEKCKGFGLDNVHFIAGDVMEIDPEGFPDLDYVTMHGLYSWVPAPVRKGALDLIAAKLKPGGCVFLSHDVLPGWHALMPIRDFLLAESEKSGKTSVMDRTMYAMSRLQQMVDQRANFVASSPSVLDWAVTLLKQDPRYVAHEYLVSCLAPMPFKTVAKDLSDIGLQYAGDTRPLLNNFRLCVPANLHADIERENDPHEREALKDYLFATTFRRSVFVRRHSTESGPVRDAGDQVWGLMATNVRPSLEFDFPSGKCRFDHPVYQAIIGTLRTQPRPLRELLQVLSGFPERALYNALMMLFAAQWVAPFRMNSGNSACDRINRQRIEGPRRDDMLLSSTYGGALPADDVERLYLFVRGTGGKNMAELGDAMHREAERRNWYRESPAFASFGADAAARRQSLHRIAARIVQQDDYYRSLGWL
ncbi:MAG: methyltransferase domain-containing protein [Betaproteobacteria bacterium]|nr:methyltransferase domain-containing protein [Betaproteobacteria bacterium]